MKAGEEDSLLYDKAKALISRLSQLGDECDEFSSSLKEPVNTFLEALAGKELALMIDNPDFAEQNLAHPNPCVQVAALYLILAVSHANQKHKELVKALAFSNFEKQVQITAIGLIPSCFDESTLGEVGRPLALLVKDELQSPEIRLAAYRSLVRLHGTLPRNGLKYVGICFPNDINWSFVNNFLEGG